MLTTTQLAAKLGLSTQRIRALAEQGRVTTAKKISPRLWLFADSAKIKPPKKMR